MVNRAMCMWHLSDRMARSWKCYCVTSSWSIRSTPSSLTDFAIATRSPAPKMTAATTHLRLLLPRLRIVHEQRVTCGRTIDELMTTLLEPTGESESGERLSDAAILRSPPGVGRVVLATILVEARAPLARRDLPALRALGGIAPVTRRNGKQNHKVMRRACNARLRYAFYHWGRIATQNDPVTKAHYAELRRKGHTHGRALRGVVDRLLSVAVAMLKTNTRYDPARRPSRQQPAGTPT